MKTSMIFVVLAGALITAGCGDGNSSSPTASVDSTHAAAQQSPMAPPATPAANTASANNGDAASAPGAAAPGAARVVQDSPIDPPTPAISMSAGVTETIDPPGT